MPRTLQLALFLTLVAPVVCALDDVTTERVADDLSYPIYAISPPGDYERLFIVEQGGDIEILNLVTGELNDDSFLDITDDIQFSGEQGLLGIAFPDDFLTEGYFFVYYSDDSSFVGDSILSRFEIDADDPDVADPDSEQILLTLNQPFSNHNGGTIQFGTDGYLYLGFGDGGSGNDPFAYGQDTSTLLGKMIRIDVSDYEATEYSIPEDNPFVDDADVEDEIWHIGLRNPYRWSFDQGTGDMYIGDVGQSSVEEISYAADGVGGLNFGWRCREGDECTDLSGCDCDDVYTDPIHPYPRLFPQCSVTGGFVYRGTAIPGLDGFYIYADWCSDDISMFSYDGVDVNDEEEITGDIAPDGTLDLENIAGFGQDQYGEVYILCRNGSGTGEVFKIVPTDFEGDDCNGNLILDSEEFEHDLAEDCNENEVIDSCDLDSGDSSDTNDNGIPDDCEFFDFVRGDPDGDGDTDIPDVLYSLAYQFTGGPGACKESMDVNDDGRIDLSDSFYQLIFMFLDGDDPPLPYPDCGSDDDTDELDCQGHADCNP